LHREGQTREPSDARTLVREIELRAARVGQVRGGAEVVWIGPLSGVLGFACGRPSLP